MSKLAVIGTIVLQPGARDEVLRALLVHRERCLNEEPGTLVFEVLVPTEEQTKLFLYELYADRASFVAHLNGKSMAQLQTEVGSKLTNVSAIECSLGAGGQS